MKNKFNISNYLKLDNNLCKTQSDVMPLSYLLDNKNDDLIVILASIREEIYETLKSVLLEVIEEKNIAEMQSLKNFSIKNKIGKYSYGKIEPLHYVESIGAFCSIALGCRTVQNHPMNFISTHPFL